MWVVELEGDVVSDFSVFHRIDDMYSMGSRKWAQLVLRLVAYPGAVQFRLKLEAQREQSEPVPAAPVVQQADPVRTVEQNIARANSAPLVPIEMQGGEMVESTQTALAMSPIGDMFSFATV